MKIAIIGAGMAGLAAARELIQHDLPAVIFEKSQGLGGRVATRRLEGFVFDTGAQSFACEGSVLEKTILENLDRTELVQIEKPIFVHDGHHLLPGDKRVNKVRRYTYLSGNTKLPKLLAANLEIRLNSPVSQLERANGKYRVGDEEFDGIILTAPVPQSSLLLWGIGEKRATAQAKYRACLSVLLGYQFELETPFHAAIDPEGTTPLQWIGLESMKCKGRSPEGSTAIVAQMSAAYSHSAWERSDEQIVQMATGQLANLFGQKMLRPAISNVKKWKYSQPEEIAMFDTVNQKGSTIVLAGDGLVGGRTELAYDSGIRAAKLLLGALS